MKSSGRLSKSFLMLIKITNEMKTKIWALIIFILYFCNFCNAVEVFTWEEFVNQVNTARGGTDIDIQNTLSADSSIGNVGNNVIINANKFGINSVPDAGYAGFDVQSGISLQINNIGSYIFNPDGTINIENSMSAFGRKGAAAGGVLNNAGNTVINNSVFSDNIYATRGGVISNSGAMQINNSLFNNNHTDYLGGAVTNDIRGNLEINSSILNNNSAETYGGAISASGILVLNNTSFYNNRVTGSIYSSGAAVYVGYGAIADINNSYFNSNNSYGEGGAIGNYGDVKIKNSLFEYNHAEDNGGAVYNSGNNVIIDTSFKNNSTKNSGGAVYNEGTLNIISENKEVIFENNREENRPNDIYNTGTVNFSGNGNIYEKRH